MLGGVLGLTKVILDNVVHIQIRFGVFDDRKLERLQRPKKNRSGREDQLRSRRSHGRSRDTKSALPRVEVSKRNNQLEKLVKKKLI